MEIFILIAPLATATLAGLAAAVISTAAATTATTIAATAVAAAPSTTAEAAFFARPGHVDLERPVGHHVTVKGLNGLLGFALVAHFHERKALGLARIAV